MRKLFCLIISILLIGTLCFGDYGVRYDRYVTFAQVQERAIVEIEAPSVEDVQHLWDQLSL